MKKHYLLLLLLATCFAGRLQAQCLLPCGTGADGNVTFGVNTSIAGGTYNYNSFTINPGVTVTVIGTSPLIIRCVGKVIIDGTLTASGANGGNGITYSQAGLGGLGTAGGANGGDGTFASGNGPITAFSGFGTGAGGFGSNWSGGGGAGYSAVGGTAGPGVGLGGPIYGAANIVTLDAGSGGGGGSGGYDCGGGGGGAGGGLIQIASCDSIIIGAGGAIRANGGNGGSDGTGNCGGGGGGSGGSVWLSAPGILNNGAIQAIAGTGGASNVPGSPYYGTGADGAPGRIRFDYNGLGGTGTVAPAVGFAGTGIAVTMVDSNVTCNGAADGFASATPTIGASPFTYLWSNAITDSVITGLVPGTYNVLVTDDNGCQFTDTLTITEPPAITATITDTNVSCNGGANGSVTITPGVGFTPFTYLWSNAVTDSANTGLSAGQYSIILTDANGCEYFDTVTITEPPVLTVAMSHTDKTTAVNNGTATATPGGGTPGYTYSWSPGGGTTPTITGLAPGIYTVVVTDTNGCSTTDTVTVFDATLNVATRNISEGIMLYPNPANDVLNVQMNLQQAGDMNISLIDYTGRILETNSVKANSGRSTYRLLTAAYPNGNYFIKIVTGTQVQNIPVSILR